MITSPTTLSGQNRLAQRRARLPFRYRAFELAVAITAVILGVAAAPLRAPAAQPSQKQTIELTIDFGNGFEMRYRSLPYAKEMTVFDALNAASKHARPLKFRYRGRGATAFVYEIDGTRNQGAKGRNWVYRVNGELGDRSAGAYRLQPGDKVLWTFARYP